MVPARCNHRRTTHLLHDFSDGATGFFDDLEATGAGDPRELAADAFARDALIPADDWKRSPLRDTPSTGDVRDLAARLGIHPAIVAGRVRRERGSYRILSNLLGHGEVRVLFPDELSESSA